MTPGRIVGSERTGDLAHVGRALFTLCALGTALAVASPSGDALHAWDALGRLCVGGAALAAALRLWFVDERPHTALAASLVTSGLVGMGSADLDRVLAGWGVGAWLTVLPTALPSQAPHRVAPLAAIAVGGGSLVGGAWSPGFAWTIAFACGLGVWLGRAMAGTRAPVHAYRLARPLGAGGLGATWAAVRTTDDLQVVVKLAPPRAPERARVRLAIEGAHLASVTSIHVVRLLDRGRDPEMGPFLVEEYIQGIDLFDAIRTYGPVSPDRAAGMLRQACDALGAVHAAGLVHRDVKPSNLLLSPLAGEGDLLRLLDFGLAHPRTVPGQGGSLGYLAPEVLGGGDATPASDVYALGCVAYFLLTGRRVADDIALQRIREGGPPPRITAYDLERAQQVPVALRDLVLAMMEPDPDQRPASAAAVARALASMDRRVDAERQRTWWARVALPSPFGDDLSGRGRR